MTQILYYFRYGTVTSVRLLPEKYCAFVNYKTKESASKAIAGLQGEECEGQKLLVRFPDHPITGTNNGQTTLRKTTPVSPPPTVTPAPKQQLQQQQGVRNLPKQSGPVNGDECYFWRTTGCIYGEKCRYKHINDHKGLDKKPWQQVI